jgi:dihydroorotate dehydrogenase (NAD+) catalytic subunit
MTALPKYDAARSYDWNFDHAPEPVQIDVPAVSGTWTYCGLPVDSPLGVPAGPLLNGRWLLYYASLGFDILTYKTVRSSARECFPLPNLLPVETGQLAESRKEIPESATMRGSWAVSFGMPSKAPDWWRRDIEATRKSLPRGKVLSVSVVGTVQPDWSLEDLADDYANCARWALESGADCIETNFSCPNVSTCDGQLYQNPESAGVVAAHVRDAIGTAPYIIKIGHMLDRVEAGRLLDAVAPYATALAMTNSVAAMIRAKDGSLYFGGQPRGICGEATRDASLAQTRMFHELITERSLSMKLVGVGGASSAKDVRDYLAAGAESVHIATAAMVDPLVAARIRAELR